MTLQELAIRERQAHKDMRGEQLRLERFEQLLLRLNEWRADPSSVRWQPVQKLIDELERER